MTIPLPVVSPRAFYRLGLLLLSLSATILPTQASAPIQLPIEVMGPDGYTVATTFSLEEGTDVDALYLKAHRLAYRDASTNPERGAKGSVQLNDGPWIDLDNSTVTCYDHEAAYGCLSGAYHTVRLTLPLEGAVAGENTLRFRFNATDNLTSGYRILELNVLKGEQPLLSPENFVQDDPASWTAPLNNASDVEAGQALWQEAELQDYPGGPVIQASCAGCHAQDGRDLEYFAFSNWSIQERAKFHGLDETQAQQIASYIRSLKDSKGVERLGRPWNPPYQTGPGLDSKPVEHWAAGAGLEAVLEKDEDMIQHTFGGSLTKNSIKEVFDINQTQNARETPLAIQLPDWMEWLTEVHPVDAPRITNEEFYETPAMHGEPFYTTYEKTRELLDENDLDVLVREGQLKQQMNRLASQITNLNGKMKEAFGYSSSVSQPGDTKEGIVSYLVKWGAVKTWEIMQEYQLEEQAPALFGEYGEPRSWLSSRRNVFEIAPHRSANNNSNFPYQSVLVGKYFSTAWYHLQLVVNGGNRETLRLWPVDWNYQPNHITGLYKHGGPAHPYRYAVSHAKMFQQYHDGKVVEESGIGFRQIHPGRYAPIEGVRGTIFEGLSPSARAQLLGGMLNATMDLIDQHETNEWPRDTLTRSDNVLRPEDYVPKVVEPNKYSKQLHAQHHADIWFTMIPYFQEAGVDETTLQRLIDWGQTMWPAGDWEGLRPEASEESSGQITIRAQGDCGSEIMELWIDSVKVEEWTLSTTPADYTYPGFTQGQVTVRFANDQYHPGQGGCEDRNLAIDYLDVCGTRYQTEAVATETATCCLFDPDKLYTNGSFDFGTLSCTPEAAPPSGGAVAQMGFRAFPNPASDQLTVEGGQDYQLRLYDLTGRPVMQYDRLSNRTTLDVAHLKPGVYLMKLQGPQDGGTQQQIIIK